MDDKRGNSKVDPPRQFSFNDYFVPTEKRNSDGTMVFHTRDGDKYIRDLSGTIRRASPKVNGKKAKRCRRSMQR